jgi:hypothetical protein
MSAMHAVINLVGGLAVAAAVVGATARAQEEERKQADRLAAVSRLSVFFGHQSVGGNLVEGLERLSAREGVGLKLVGGPAAAGAFAHAAIGANGDPELKMKAFAQAVDGGPGAGAQVAMMKLCYVDFDAPVDPGKLFARYQETIAGLRARHPGTTFVHVTTPLTAAQGGWKPLVKKVLGKESSEARNARREQYNALMRSAYQGKEPLFDLAAVESTRPDGSRELASFAGKQVPMLVPAYTGDGGHLNAEGQDRAAAALVALLASLPAGPVGDAR